MPTHFLATMFAVFSSAAISFSWRLAPHVPRPPRQAVEEVRALSHWSPSTPGGSLLVIEKGEVTLHYSCGAAQLGAPGSCDAATLYRPQGARTTVVRTLLDALIRDDLLDLEAPLAQILPEFAAHQAERTFGDLVDGQVPFADLETLIHFRYRDEAGRINRAEAARMLARAGPQGGQAAALSHEILLAVAIERTQSRPLDDLVGEFVLPGLEAGHAVWIPEPVVPWPHGAPRYERGWKQPGWVGQPETRIVTDHDALWLTSAGLARLCETLIAHAESLEPRSPLLEIIDSMSGLMSTRSAACVHLRERDLTVVWASSRKGRRSIASEVARRVTGVVGMDRGGGTFRFEGGGIQHRGRFPCPYRDRWPLAQFRVPELELEFRLSKNDRGSLLMIGPWGASSAAFARTERIDGESWVTAAATLPARELADRVEIQFQRGHGRFLEPRFLSFTRGVDPQKRLTRLRITR
ncbi:MAG: serine hydrolase domain-containing protein [Planctomycetota bacterium]